MSKCEHGKRKSRCVVCGGSEICPHLRIKYNCKDCTTEIAKNASYIFFK